MVRPVKSRREGRLCCYEIPIAWEKVKKTAKVYERRKLRYIVWMVARLSFLTTGETGGLYKEYKSTCELPNQWESFQKSPSTKEFRCLLRCVSRTCHRPPFRTPPCGMYPEHATDLHSGHPRTLLRILQCTIQTRYLRSSSLLDND